MTAIRGRGSVPGSNGRNIAARSDAAPADEITGVSRFHLAPTSSRCICMKNLPEPVHIERRFAPTALMLGNFVTGTSILAPAGMLSGLSGGLDVTIRDAGILITFGAIVLCIGSPLAAWLTNPTSPPT